MPVYEYQGQHYELSTTNPVEAKSKIMAHLGQSQPTAPKEDLQLKGEKEAAAKGQVYVKPALGMSAEQTAALYSFAESASSTLRGIGQMLGFHKKETATEVRTREALEKAPEYRKGALTGSITGTIADPVTYALPIAKAKTIGEFVKASAVMGAATGFAGAGTEETSRGKEAVYGAAGGAAGGAILGSVIRVGGKAFGKDWLPWKATPEEKKIVTEEILKQNPESSEKDINHFLNAPEDAHINARARAEKLIEEGSSKSKVEAVIKKNPLVGHYLDQYRETYEGLKQSKLGETLQGEVLPKETKPESQLPRLTQTAFRNKKTGEVTASGPKHPDIVKEQTKDTHEPGFVDEKGNFLTRKEADKRARETGQIAEDHQLEKPEEGLHSGDLRSNGEKGFAHPQLLANVAGAGIGATLDPKDPLTGAAVGLGVAHGGGKIAEKVAATLLEKTPNKESPVGEFFSNLSEGVDKAFGQIGTRLSNESPELGKKALDVERNIKVDTYNGITGADKFFTHVAKDFTREEEEAVKLAWLNGDRKAIENNLRSPEAKESFRSLITTIDNLGKELSSRGLLKGTIEGYLPRMVKDREGLLKSLDLKTRTAIEEALHKAQSAKGGQSLSDTEFADVINKYMRGYIPPGVGKAGYRKERVFEDVSKDMQQYYYDPIETYHTYVSRAVSDIHTADFFGKSKVTKDGILDVDASIGNFLAKQLADKKINFDQFDRVKNLLETRYKFGNQISNKYVQEYKNWTTGFLLADIGASIQNLGDLTMANFIYGMKPAMSAIAQKLTGKNQLSVKDFGLMDHISEEFVSTTRSKRYVDRALKLSGWGIFDPLGKEVALNSSLNRGQAWSNSEAGINKLQARYGDAFGSDFPQLVKDLQSGKVTDNVKAMAFFDVVKHQPLTKLQRTEFATKNPNLGGLLYQFKSFMLSQANLMREEAYNQLKKGNTAEGLKRLATIGTGFAAVGAGNASIQNFLMDRPEDFSGTDMFFNATKEFGLSQFTWEKIKSGDVKGTVSSVVSPPTSLLEHWVKKDPKTGKLILDEPGIARKIPLVGREISARMPETKEKERKKREKELRKRRKEAGLE